MMREVSRQVDMSYRITDRVKLSQIPLLLFLIAGCSLACDTAHPSDDSLIQNFQSHEADFDQLIRMAAEGSKVVRIASDFTWTEKSAAWPRPESELGFSKERWDEYRRLFKKLDLDAGILNYQPDLVFLVASTQGLLTGGSGKGYVYSLKEPSPIVESLKDVSFEGSEKSMNFAYKKLKGHWYLFYDVTT
jgi:hypothetical protein